MAANCSGAFGSWGAAKRDPSGTGQEGLATVVSGLLLIISATTVGKCVQNTNHKMAGYMLLGFLGSEQMLNMIHIEYARRYLTTIMIVCQAFVAFESATHLIHSKEVKQFWKHAVPWSLVRLFVCFFAGFGIFRVFANSNGFVKVMTNDGWEATPRLTGALGAAASLALGMVCTTAEPSATLEFLKEMRAAGLHSAMSIRLASITILLSMLLMSVLTPIISTMQHSIEYAVYSTIVSIVLTLFVALVLWRVVLVILYLPSKRFVAWICGSDVLRVYTDEADRVFKLALVLTITCSIFWLANFLDSLGLEADSCGYTFDTSCFGEQLIRTWGNSSGDCKRDFSAAGPWSAGLAVSFQPFPATFLASYLIMSGCKARNGAPVRWRLHLQPLSPYFKVAIGTISGLWVRPGTIFGGYGIIAIFIFVLRVAGVWLCGTLSLLGLRRGLSFQESFLGGPLYLMQAQLSLAVLWELQIRAPAFATAPYAYGSTGWAVIFLELFFGVPMMRLALTFVRERRQDRIGRSLILGAEGAPPVITLKLIDWEVRAGPLDSHVGELMWTVRDTEEVAQIDEAAVRSVTLGVRPDAFISMLQEDKLNYDACELLRHKFDVARCVTQTMDPSWVPKFQSLGALGSGTGDVCILDHMTASMQNLLDQFVTSPQSAIMLLHDDPGADVIKVTITEKEAGIAIHDMKLPDDIQVLTIQRGLTPIVPHGHTRLQKTDELMICGRPNSLASVTALKKGKVVLLMGR